MLYYIVDNVILWCVGVPVAIMFAAYLIGIAVMCTKELWRTREKPRNKMPRDEKANPSV